MTVGIYRIVLSDGRCYVGQSANVEARWAGHRCDLRRGRHHAPYLQRCWNKYGEDAFTFEVMEECSVGALTEREWAWMDALDSVFNVCPPAGSGRGWTHTPESIAKISAALKGRPKSAEMRARLSATRKGQRHSAETRAKMREIHNNRSAETLARMAAANRARAAQVVAAETRAKISAAGRGRKHSPETREKIRLSNKAHFAANPRPPLTAEHRAAISAGLRARRTAAPSQTSLF